MPVRVLALAKSAMNAETIRLHCCLSFESCEMDWSDSLSGNTSSTGGGKGTVICRIFAAAACGIVHWSLFSAVRCVFMVPGDSTDSACRPRAVGSIGQCPCTLWLNSAGHSHRRVKGVPESQSPYDE
jgi:hypothetical protein